jgi:hypothetical protein
MGIKKPGNALRPCRTCNIKAQRRLPIEQGGQEIQNEPLHKSKDELQPDALGEPQRSVPNQRRQPQTLYIPHTDYDFTSPLIRTDLRRTIKEVERARSSEFRTLFGITYSSILLELRSVYFPRSFLVNIIYYMLFFVCNHIASSYYSYGKLPSLYYSIVLARNESCFRLKPSAVVFPAYKRKQASVFLLTVGTSDREPYLAHDPLDQRGLWAFRPPES